MCGEGPGPEGKADRLILYNACVCVHEKGGGGTNVPGIER